LVQKEKSEGNLKLLHLNKHKAYRLKEGANLQKRKKALAWTVSELPGFFQVANDRDSAAS